MNLQWFALHVRSRFEKHVESHLTGKGYEVFLPTYVSKRRWTDRVKSISLPLFPSYVFCRFDVSHRLPVLVSPGVNFVVGSVGPEAINDSEIAAIRLVQNSGIAARPWPFLQAGAVVRIEDGPLEGLSGIIIREKGIDRLIVSVSLLMRSVSVEVPRCSVKPLGTVPARRERTFAVISSSEGIMTEPQMTEVGERVG